ncbi:BadF/BadG/BcrA/BcrD ATPase family protein [Alteromonas facilis]|uniref:BadF/BadG/BcrA/BcrD ATPase family protein n=1 Tax=Alteromonas facilis TaxID=2048004 RepID=UPI000C281343|nr:BadF/BadG/BcrA/BcrD ATPase family protein [Alteromonas facilis]
MLAVPAPISIGIDGGGTKCSAYVMDKNLHIIGKGLAGSANIARDFDNATLSIETAIHAALNDAKMPIGAPTQMPPIVAGLAGYNVQSAKQKLALWASQFPSFHATSDLETSLFGAHAGADGSVLIIGTGSCAAGLKQRTVKQWGGQGFLLGDKGSGAWIGQQAVRKVLLALDNVDNQVTPSFIETITTYLGTQGNTEIIEKLCQASPATFAKLAPVVMSLANQGCETARGIIIEGAGYLSDIAKQALVFSGGNIVITGGMGSSMRHWLCEEVQAQIVEPSYGAETGAVIWHHASN